MRIWICWLYLMLSVPVFGHGDVHELIANLDRQIEESPDDTELYLRRANLLRQHNEYTRAMQDLARVEELNPQLPERFYVQAKIYLAREKWESAREALDTFIEMHPEDSEPYALRSRALLNLGEMQLAEADALRAVELHDHAPLQLHLDYIELLVMQDDMDAALAAYDRAEQSLGSLPVLLMEKAQMLSDRERYEEASAAYARLRELQPRLGFSCWTKEAGMWAKQDHQRMLACVQQAKLAWEALPERQRTALQDQYTALIKTEQSEFK